MSELKIVVTGASGRMGRTLIREIAQGSGTFLIGGRFSDGLDALLEPRFVNRHLPEVIVASIGSEAGLRA